MDGRLPALALALQTLALLLLAGSTAHAAPLTWEQLPAANGAAPSPRRNAGIVFDVARGRLVLFGGEDASGDHRNDTWALNLTSRTWRELQSAAVPTGRSSFVAGHWTTGGHDEYVIATGQRDGGQLNDIWALDLTTDQWRQLPSNNAPQVRYGAVGGIWPGQDQLWLTHGFARMRYSNTLFYDLNLQTWVQVHGAINSYDPTAPHARCLSAGGLASPNHLVLYGGCQQNGFTGGPCPSRDAWIMRTDSAQWSVAGLAVNGRNFAAMARLPGAGSEGLMLLYGGSEYGGQVIRNTRAPDAEVDLFDASTGTWVRLRAAASSNDSVPGWRTGPSLATADDRIYMFGGQLRSGGALQNDVWMLTGSALESPRLGEPAPSYFLYPMLHGLFMFLGWGVCLQGGWVVARYYRHRDPLWFKLHKALNIAGLLLSSIGFVLVYIGGAKNPIFAHGIIGIAVTLLGLWQPLNAYFRPHKTPTGGTVNKDHTGPNIADGAGAGHGQRQHRLDRRRAWEWLHKGSGRLAVVLALANISLGLLLVGAPTGVWAAWFALLGLFVVAVCALEVRLRRQWRAMAGNCCKQSVGKGRHNVAARVAAGSSEHDTGADHEIMACGKEAMQPA